MKRAATSAPADVAPEPHSARLLHAIADARRQLDHFNREDLPAYDDWMAARFGTLLSAVRDLRARTEELQEMLDRIDGLAFDENIPHHRAYSRLFENYAGPEWFANEVGLRLSDLEGDDAPPDAEPEEEDPYHDRLASAFAELMDPYGDPDAEMNVIAVREEKMRVLYRQLARRLHPDHHPEAADNPWFEWWHQAQEAYNQGDVARLEVLLTLTEVEAGELPEPRSRDETAALLRKLRRTLSHLSYQLDAGRAHPAWAFGIVRDRQPLELQFERDRFRERFTLEREFRSLDAKLRRWSRPPRVVVRPSAPITARTEAPRRLVWIQLEFFFVRELDRLHPRRWD